MRLIINGLLSIYTFIIFLGPSTLYSQPYIINSKEGYSNVRESANLNARVISTLKNNTVIIVDIIEDPDIESNKWLKIFFYKNKPFSIIEPLKDNSMDYGYIHKSQVKELRKLQIAKPTEIKMTYEIKRFSKENYKIDYYEGNEGYPLTINNALYYLTDCGMPKTSIVKASTKIDTNHIEIPIKLVWGIISAQNNFEYFKNADTYYAYQEVGDGACFNYVVWVFKEGKLVQRFIGFI